jgi:hypothetical protein
MVTTIVGIVVGLTFLFGFGNVLALGLRLGVPIWVALLIPVGFRRSEGRAAARPSQPSVRADVVAVRLLCAPPPDAMRGSTGVEDHTNTRIRAKV